MRPLEVGDVVQYKDVLNEGYQGVTGVIKRRFAERLTVVVQWSDGHPDTEEFEEELVLIRSGESTAT